MSTVGRDGPIAARAGIAAVFGAAAAICIGAWVDWRYAPACGWIVAAAVFLCWTWAVIARMSPSRTAAHATREDPTRVATDIAGPVGVGSVAAAWLVVHTIFTLRYALLYFADPQGAVDFNQTDAPAYADFAYLAFTIGMTYQVSDTDLKTHAIRTTALRHALLSYLFGALILAVAVNLIAGLAH